MNVDDLVHIKIADAIHRVLARAIEEYSKAHDSAVQHLNLEGAAAHELALAAVLDEVGRSYAAAALNQVAEVFGIQMGEDAAVAVGDIATTLDLLRAPKTDHGDQRGWGNRRSG